MDLYNDPGHARLTHLVRNRPQLAAFLKTAEFEDSPDGLPSSAFAWGAERRYPVHTAEHAVVSKLYAEDDPRVPAVVKVAIDEALLAYGVPSSVYASAPAQEKTAAQLEEDYLFPDARAYPVRSAQEVRFAEARLLGQLDEIPLNERPRIFNKLAHAAAHHGVDLRPASQAYGLAAQCDEGLLAERIADRMYMTKNASVRERYRELGEAVTREPHSVKKFAVRTKLATLLEALDREAGIVYDKRTPDPLQTVFNAPTKLGAQGINLGGASYDLGQLCGVPSSFYQDALGPEVASEIAPGGKVQPELIASILPTLPADMLQIFRQALLSAGVRPLGA